MLQNDNYCMSKYINIPMIIMFKILIIFFYVAMHQSVSPHSIFGASSAKGFKNWTQQSNGLLCLEELFGLWVSKRLNS